MKNKLIINISGKIPNQKEIEALISKTKEIYIKAIELAYKEGYKIREITEIVGIPRRTLQGVLKRKSEEILGYTLTFEQLRQFFMIDLINKGYSPEFISNKMGYSRKDIVLEKRKIAGYINPKLRLKVLSRDNFRCVYCGSTSKLHIDHKIPVSIGGKTEENNLQTLCEECNLGKGNTL